MALAKKMLTSEWFYLETQRLILRIIDVITYIATVQEIMLFLNILFRELEVFTPICNGLVSGKKNLLMRFWKCNSTIFLWEISLK